MDGLATKQDKDQVHVARVCISPIRYILTSSHVIEPGMKYVGSCPSWKGGWTLLKVGKDLNLMVRLYFKWKKQALKGPTTLI